MLQTIIKMLKAIGFDWPRKHGAVAETRKQESESFPPSEKRWSIRHPRSKGQRKCAVIAADGRDSLVERNGEPVGIILEVGPWRCDGSNYR